MAGTSRAMTATMIRHDGKCTSRGVSSLFPPRRSRCRTGRCKMRWADVRHLRIFAHMSRRRSRPSSGNPRNRRRESRYEPASNVARIAECRRSLGRFASSRFLDQSDLRVATFENDVCRHGSSDLGKSQGIAIKSQTFIEQRNVDGNRVPHAHAPFARGCQLVGLTAAQAVDLGAPSRAMMPDRSRITFDLEANSPTSVLGRRSSF